VISIAKSLHRRRIPIANSGDVGVMAPQSLRVCPHAICICTIATSLMHSTIDYCNSLLLILPATQSNRLHHVLNSAARAVTKTPKFHQITPILKSLHWLKINERIKYRFSLSHINLAKLVNLLSSALFFHSLHIVVLGLPLL